jgi:tetratricopeptide (TPR) repeat protein
VTLGRLGRCLEAQGGPDQAADVYRQELAVLAQLEQSDGVKRLTGAAHSDLADVLRDIGQYGEARKEYEAALEIDRALGDERGAAVDLGQLGTLALRQGDLAEARRRYLDALNAFRAIAEPQMEAVAWHQLGAVAQEAKDWAEAERCYKESLALEERYGDMAGAARTCNQLAIVAERAGRPDEAERWYKRAIEGFKDTGQTRYEATASSNLANLYLTQGRLDEAERFAHRAREIDETLDLSSEPWKDYGILAQIADKRGRAEEARQWRRKEQETYQAFVDRSGGQADANVRKWEPVIQAVVAVCNGDTQVMQQLEPFFQRMETTDDWRNLIPVIRRILAGERGIELTEGLDRTDAAIVRRILGLLAGEERPPPQPSPLQGEGAAPSPFEGEGRGEGQSEGLSLEQLLNLVIAGVKGDAQAGQAAYQFAQALQQPGAPPELQAIGKGLQRVLEGLRGEEAVAGLPDQAAEIVRLVLGRVK